MPDQKTVQRAVIGLVVVGTLLILARHIRFSTHAACPLGRDWDFHIQNAWKIHACGFHFDRILQWYKTAGYDAVRWPPVHYWLAHLLRVLCLGDAFSSLYLTNGLWFLVLAASLYDAGNRIGPRPWTGLIAMGFGAWNFVVTAWQMKEINLDFAASAATAAVLAVHLRTQNFTKRGPSLFLGVVIAAALLTKTITALFIAPVLAMSVLRGLRTEENRNARIGNIVLCAGLVIALCAWFWIPMLRSIGREFDGESLQSHQAVLQNAGLWIRLLFSIPMVFFALPALVASVVAVATRHREVLPYVVSYAAAGVFFLNIKTVVPHYYFPAQPLAALIVAGALGRTGPRVSGAAAGIAVILFLFPSLFSRFEPLRCDSETNTFGDAIRQLGSSFSVEWRDVPEVSIGVITCHSMATESIRRGVIGGAIALAREEDAWTHAFRKESPMTALFCRDDTPQEKLANIVEQPLIFVVEPDDMDRVDPCCTQMRSLSAALKATHRIEADIPLRYGAQYDVNPSLGFGSGYRVVAFKKLITADF